MNGKFSYLTNAVAAAVVSLAISQTGVSAMPLSVQHEQVAAFKNEPATLLKNFPLDGTTVSERLSKANAFADHVSNLVIADFGVVDMLMEVARQNSQCRAAIGAGLARAAQAIVPDRPGVASLLQEKVATSGISELVTAFVSSDFMTAALKKGSGGYRGLGGRLTLPDELGSKRYDLNVVYDSKTPRRNISYLFEPITTGGEDESTISPTER